VYATLEQLRHEGLASIDDSRGSSRRTYELTQAGLARGSGLARRLDAETVGYMRAVGEFVRSQSFAGLVSSIYKAYPEMKVNSVFQG